MAASVARYTVLYTRQKLQKAKVWKDGVLTHAPSGRLSLYDGSGNVIDEGHRRSPPTPGETIELDCNLVQVESGAEPQQRSPRAVSPQGRAAKRPRLAHSEQPPPSPVPGGGCGAQPHGGGVSQDRSLVLPHPPRRSARQVLWLLFPNLAQDGLVGDAAACPAP
eukprot:TRINITY_DN48362_c0_g1_i1.p2 TRINITY_DN48362_c0_g1~~TRINITY_DN48362_c0_g1_i1.p2  ORF type:complete len:164 (+),score=17.16 TRINITY_DN48362_c0_g1_i1:69-560(+)